MIRFIIFCMVCMLVLTASALAIGCQPSNVPNASSNTADTPTSDEKEEELIFLSKRGYISETGCPTIIGEVKNVADFSMENILITASFYCSKGKEVGAKEDMAATASYTEVEILAPGETSPFKVALSHEELSMLVNFDVDKIEKFKVEVSDYNSTDEELYKSFEISQSTGELNNTTGHYTVVGTVRNIGNETAGPIKIVGTFYDSQTKIIEVVYTHIQDPLLPVDEAQFEITILDETISQRIETYHIQAVRQ